MTESFTACTKCKHLLSSGPIWYDNFCSAIIREKVRDPYDGIWKYGGVNDLGGEYVTNQRHPHVRTVNTDGKCILYEKR